MLKRILFGLIGLCIGIGPIAAQQSVPQPAGQFWLDLSASPPVWRPASGTYPLPVTASVSVGPFLPSLVFNTCTATGSSCSSTAIPTNTGSVVLFNSGTTTVSCTMASGAATATASKLQIPASSWLGLATTGYDHYACIDQSGSASNVVIASGGTGLPAGAGGGGGSGGGGAITAASGAYASGSIGSGAMVDLLTFQGTKAAGTAAANSLLIGGVYNSSPLTLTTGQQSALQFDANGYAKVNVAAGGAGGGAVYGPTAAGSAAANPPVLCGGTIDGTATGTVKNCEVVAGGSAGLTDLGLVVQDPQLLAAAGKGVATNGATYPSQSIGVGWKDGSGNIQPFAAATPPPFNIGQINGVTPLMGNGVTGTGSPRVTVASDNTPFGVLAQTQAVASGGWSTKWFVAANSDNATNLKNAAGIVHGIQIYGISSTPAWLKFYDKASSPTCGSDTIVAQYLIPAASTAANGAGNNAIVLDKQFSTGISYCVVTGIGATDDTAVAAANFVINIGYK